MNFRLHIENNRYSRRNEQQQAYLHSPSICLTLGGSRLAGRGIDIKTLCRSNISKASYSILTKVSLPETVGQQLTGERNKSISSLKMERNYCLRLKWIHNINPPVNGKEASSMPWILHFIRLTSLWPVGKGLFGSFKPTTWLLLNNSLLMLGWVLKLRPGMFWFSICKIDITSRLSQ